PFFQLDTGDIRPGKHQITLEISDAGGAIGTATATLIVIERPPEPSLAANPQDPAAGQTVNVTGGTKPSLTETEPKFSFGDAPAELWLGIGAALLALAMLVYLLLSPSITIVPRIDLQSLTVATSGKIDSHCAIGVRAARGEYRCRIDLDGALVN